MLKTTPPTDTTAPLKGAATDASENASELWDKTVALLPQAVIACVIVIVGVIIAKLLRRYMRRVLTKKYNIGFARVMSRIIMWALVLVVILVAFAVVFPSVNMMSVIGSLGFVSLAVGFALKDIIENAFAGLLLMYRESFVVGDQIEVQEIFGDVEAVNVRETVIRRRDGQRVIIPNRDVYKSTIRIQTANKLRRYEFKLEFDYNVDHRRVIDTLVNSMVGVEGVEKDPPPAGRIDDTTSEEVVITLRGWTKSEQSFFNATRNRAIQKVITTMVNEGIPLPDSVVPIEVDTPIKIDETVEPTTDNDAPNTTGEAKKATSDGGDSAPQKQATRNSPAAKQSEKSAASQRNNDSSRTPKSVAPADQPSAHKATSTRSGAGSSTSKRAPAAGTDHDDRPTPRGQRSGSGAGSTTTGSAATNTTPRRSGGDSAVTVTTGSSTSGHAKRSPKKDAATKNTAAKNAVGKNTAAKNAAGKNSDSKNSAASGSADESATTAGRSGAGGTQRGGSAQGAGAAKDHRGHTRAKDWVSDTHDSDDYLS